LSWIIGPWIIEKRRWSNTNGWTGACTNCLTTHGQRARSRSGTRDATTAPL